MKDTALRENTVYKRHMEEKDINVLQKMQMSLHKLWYMNVRPIYYAC